MLGGDREAMTLGHAAAPTRYPGRGRSVGARGAPPDALDERGRWISSVDAPPRDASARRERTFDASARSSARPSSVSRVQRSKLAFDTGTWTSSPITETSESQASAKPAALQKTKSQQNAGLPAPRTQDRKPTNGAEHGSPEKHPRERRPATINLWVRSHRPPIPRIRATTRARIHCRSSAIKRPGYTVWNVSAGGSGMRAVTLTCTPPEPRPAKPPAWPCQSQQRPTAPRVEE